MLSKKNAIKSFKEKIPNNYNIYSNEDENNIKENNKELLKKLNEKYNNIKLSNLENQYNDYQKPNYNEINPQYEEQPEINSINNQENSKYIKPFNQINKKPREKKSHNNMTKKLNINDNNYCYIKKNNYVNSEEDKDSI